MIFSVYRLMMGFWLAFKQCISGAVVVRHQIVSLVVIFYARWSECALWSLISIFAILAEGVLWNDYSKIHTYNKVGRVTQYADSKEQERCLIKRIMAERVKRFTARTHKQHTAYYLECQLAHARQAASNTNNFSQWTIEVAEQSTQSEKPKG